MFLIGHSHLTCIVEAAQSRGEPVDALNLWGFRRIGPPVSYEGGVPHLHPVIVERLRGPVFSTLGGSAHDVLGMVEHPRLFDLILPEAPDLPLMEGADILPSAAVLRIMEGMMRETLDIVTALVKRSPAPVYQIESPPPYPDGEHLSRVLSVLLDTPVGGAFLHPGSDVRPDAASGGYRVSDKYLRYKLWRLNAQLFAFAGHANEIYGAMVLDQIKALSEGA